MIESVTDLIEMSRHWRDAEIFMSVTLIHMLIFMSHDYVICWCRHIVLIIAVD